MQATELAQQAHPGLWIKQARQNLGISRADLAEASGFDRTYIWRIETGERIGTDKTIAALANTIGAIAASRLEGGAA